MHRSVSRLTVTDKNDILIKKYVDTKYVGWTETGDWDCGMDLNFDLTSPDMWDSNSIDLSH